MPASTLKAIIAFPNVAAGASSAVAHTLNVNGTGVIPDKVELMSDSTFSYVAADDTNLTVRNDGSAAATCYALVEYWYSANRVFAQPLSQLTPAPFVVSPGTPGVIGGTGVTFRQDGTTLDVYVDQINGNDGNSGLSAAAALQTLPALRDRFPWYYRAGARLVVHLLNDTAAPITYRAEAIDIGAGGEALSGSVGYRGPEMILITPTTGPATAALDVVPAVQVDQTNTPSGVGNRTRFDFTTAAPGWTPGDLSRAFARVTRGAVQVFFELPIIENGADYFIVDSINIVGKLLATDTVEIVQPAVYIKGLVGSPNYEFLAITGQAGVCPQTIAGLDTGYPAFERIGFGSYYAVGVFGLTFDRCHTEGPFPCIHLGGSYQFMNTLYNASLNVIGRSSTWLYSRAESPTDPIYQPGTGVYEASTGPMIVIHDAFSEGLVVGGSSYDAPRGVGNYVSPTALGISIYGAAYDGVRVDALSEFIVPKDGSFIGGTGNGTYQGVGVRSRHGSVARVPRITTNVTITGADGDLKVEQGAAISYGSGVGQFREVAGWDGNFTRVLEGTATHPTGDSSRITSWDFRVGNH